MEHVSLEGGLYIVSVSGGTADREIITVFIELYWLMLPAVKGV